VDPLRGNYQEETESRRHRGDHQYPEGQVWFDSHGDEGHRYPERRSAGRPYSAPPGAIGQVGPAETQHRPHGPGEAQQPAHWDPGAAPAPHWDPNAGQHWDQTATAAPATTTRESRRASRSATPSPGGRVGRSASALLLTVVVVIAAVPVARVLLSGAFGSMRSTGAVVSGLLLLLGLPLGAVGLHGLGSEAAKGAGPVAAWLRPPVAYLTAALVMFIAAGLAAR
jgi:hypothetical protein